jgi:hypothetical protein
MVRFASTASNHIGGDTHLRHRRARSRGASGLWSIVLVCGCAAFIGVALVMFWVASRGGYVDRPAIAAAGIARVAHAAIGRPDPAAAGSAVADAGPPEPAPTETAAASAIPTADAAAPVAETDLDAGDVFEDPTPAVHPAAPGTPAPKATKKRRVRQRFKRR